MLINVVLCLIISLKITAPLVQPLLTDCVDKPPMEAAFLFMESQEWKPVFGFEEFYEVNKLGVVRTIYSIRRLDLEPKHHTIRAGSRFKVGDKFSPRVWSGKPYNSKQIIIAPDIEVKKVFEIGIYSGIVIDKKGFCEAYNYKPSENLTKLSSNDGLSVQDMLDWFQVEKKKEFTGQIICWNENVNY